MPGTFADFQRDPFLPSAGSSKYRREVPYSWGPLKIGPWAPLALFCSGEKVQFHFEPSLEGIEMKAQQGLLAGKLVAAWSRSETPFSPSSSSAALLASLPGFRKISEKCFPLIT
jgi:hypothetical protein